MHLWHKYIYNNLSGQSMKHYLRHYQLKPSQHRMPFPDKGTALRSPPLHYQQQCPLYAFHVSVSHHQQDVPTVTKHPLLHNHAPHTMQSLSYHAKADPTLLEYDNDSYLLNKNLDVSSRSQYLVHLQRLHAQYSFAIVLPQSKQSQH